MCHDGPLNLQGGTVGSVTSYHILSILQHNPCLKPNNHTVSGRDSYSNHYSVYALLHENENISYSVVTLEVRVCMLERLHKTMAVMNIINGAKVVSTHSGIIWKDSAA